MELTNHDCIGFISVYLIYWRVSIYYLVIEIRKLTANLCVKLRVKIYTMYDKTANKSAKEGNWNL